MTYKFFISYNFIFDTNWICKLYADWLYFGNYYYWETNNLVITDVYLEESLLIPCEVSRAQSSLVSWVTTASCLDTVTFTGRGTLTAPLTASGSRGDCILTPRFSFSQIGEVFLSPYKLENYCSTLGPWIYVLLLGLPVTSRPSWRPRSPFPEDSILS